MNSKIASVKINERLEKLDSSDYDNITRDQKEEAVNKAAIDVQREIIKQANEGNILRVDDIQVTLREQKMSVINKDKFVESSKVPSDYVSYKRLTPKCSKGDCSNVTIKSTLVEEANVDELLMDFNSKPSFDFEQAFHTMMGNRYRVYHDDNFTINELKLIYYRKPQVISFLPANQLKEWEWNDSIAEVIIDRAVKILAGDTANTEVFQATTERLNSTN